MMWTVKRGPQSADPALEPVELIILKQKLAKLSSNICKCLSNKPGCTNPSSTVVHIRPNHKEVQAAERKASSHDRFTQANPDSIREDREELNKILTKDVLCPTCFLTMNLLRGGTLKILKDEESETKNAMFSSDKATEKIVQSVEKTTSSTIKSNRLFPDVSMYSCDTVSSSPEMERSPHQVTFMKGTENFQQTSRTDAMPCVCLEHFVKSIRPPLMDFYAY